MIRGVFVVKSVFWGAAAALLLAVSPVFSAELKIGYVNYARLLQESPQAKSIQESLRTEFEPRQRDLVNRQKSLKARADKFQRDAATMTDDQRTSEAKELRDTDRDLQQKQSDLQDDFNAKKNEELSRLQRSLIQEVQSYAKAQGYDLVLAEGVIYATSSIDLTPAILTRLKSDAGNSGSAAPKSGKTSRGK
jgi:outer membrane protein